jgi:AraC family transcriptional regulator of adaptative response/methylated-DNA-[protein]-cysteine methyltransferase
MKTARANRIDDNARWEAVLARDTRADGQFVYGVRSTGIFCRPSCASRKPKRSNVIFFETCEDAARAGFRRCRRCQPERLAADPWIQKIQRACMYLANVEGHPSLATLAARVGGSPYHLQRKFKELVGVSPREFAAASRLGKVRRELRKGEDVTGALFSAGYSSSSRFYERTARRLGMTPTTYQKGGAGMSIDYTIVNGAGGRVLVAGTEKGVCAVVMGTDDVTLERDLRREYPHAAIGRGADRLSRWVGEIVRRAEGAAPRHDLPRDVRATAFQWQVWNALTRIPRGETCTYGDVAATIGKPTAVRAVARACAANPVAVAIPCHRVVPRAGGIGGYRWGTSRKRALLEAESRKDG